MSNGSPEDRCARPSSFAVRGLCETRGPANLPAGTYSATVRISATGATGSPASVSVTLVVQAPQATVNITAVANGASFQAGCVSATWISILGANLSQTIRTWQDSDFVNGLLPTSLDGVSVTINGRAAYVGYIKPHSSRRAGAGRCDCGRGPGPGDHGTGPKQQLEGAGASLVPLIGGSNWNTGVTVEGASPDSHAGNSASAADQRVRPGSAPQYMRTFTGPRRES
jgi:hypothetical protein